jgi:thioester reductase-like protein
LTGVTGGLGAHLLARLVFSPNVTTVWAFARASSDEEALSRVLHSLKARGIDLTDSNVEHKIIAVASDLSKPDFGISDSLLLKNLRDTVTVAIHSAWAVNFNLPVQSFEDQHIKAVHSLINFCRSSPTKPARFFFCSSVSAAGGTPKPGTVLEGPVADIAHVQGTGYAQSKYVAEHITIAAMRHVGLEARVLRVGQLVGDSRIGQWNPSEGIPLMMRTAQTLGALPALDEEMSWLPVDYAAKIILDLCCINASESGSTMSSHVDDPDVVYHVLNPIRFHWTRDMLPALSAAGLSFEVLPTEKWMAKLRSSSRDPVLNPPIKLLNWFESKYNDEALERSKGKGPLVYLTEDTAKASETMGHLPDITDTAFVKKMVDRLRLHWDGAAETE